MTINLERCSPVQLNGEPVKTEIRDGWKIVCQYAAEHGKGLRIVDLSHFPRWDIQDKFLENIQPYGNVIPTKPGQVLKDRQFLIGRLNATQAIAWHFAPETPVLPQNGPFTDITEAAAALALVGPNVFDMVEMLCSLDLSNPHIQPPFLLQGPFSHVPCHIWVLDRHDSEGCIALTCSRGYGKDMVNAVLQAGAQWGILPEGEDVFKSCLGW